MREYQSRRIALPGGREIEVVYFSDPDDALAGAAWEAGAFCDGPVAARTAPAELHLCPECSGDLVYPVDWIDVDGCWTIVRRCPDCEWTHRGEFTQEQAEDFDDALTDGSEEMLCALRRMARRNMEDDVERLVTAIRDGLIEPIDF